MNTLSPIRRRRKQDAADNGDQAVAESKPASKPPPDPRIKALWRFATSITIFTVVGAFFLGFEDPWVQPLIALATAYSLDVVLENLEAFSCGRSPCYSGKGVKGFIEFLLPAHITALSVAFLIYPGSRMGLIVFAVAIAMCSKYILTVRVKGRKRHFLNPSNLGIAVTLLAFPSVGITPAYHFTENVSHNALAWVIPILIICAGSMLNVMLTKKWPLILGWIGGFVVQAVLRSAIFATPLVAPLLPMTGLVFWLYTNYMITDPGTSPVKPRNQAVFGASVAITYGILVVAHVAFGLFFALTIVCAMRGLVLAAPAWQAALRSRMRPATAPVGKPAGEVVS
jgi:hypothetical protein